MKSFPDPGFHGSPPLRKEEAEKLLDPLFERLVGLQERLYAENRRSLLVVLQGMDTSADAEEDQPALPEGVVRSESDPDPLNALRMSPL